MPNICAGIVTFNPDLERLEENISSIAEQVSCLLLVDNASENISGIQAIIRKHTTSRISLYRFGTNRGIAAALNKLCSEAYKSQMDWIITLDQDSVCPPGMVDSFLRYTGNNNVAIICPLIRDRNREASAGPAESTTEVERCISSGSMISLREWRSLGGFDETMFIDGVDFDFCYRVRKKRKTILRVNETVLLHELGSIQVRKFLRWDVIVKNHAAFRKFYIARNTVYLARKNKTSLLKAFLQICKQLVICILFEKEKQQKCRRIVQGAKEGAFCSIYRHEGDSLL